MYHKNRFSEIHSFYKFLGKNDLPDTDILCDTLRLLADKRNSTGLFNQSHAFNRNIRIMYELRP